MIWTPDVQAAQDAHRESARKKALDMTSRRPPLHRAPPGAAELRGFTGVDGARLRAKLNAMAKGVLARPPKGLIQVPRKRRGRRPL